MKNTRSSGQGTAVVEVVVEDGTDHVIIHEVDPGPQEASGGVASVTPQRFGWWSYFRGALAILAAICVVCLVAGKVFYDDWKAREIGQQHTVSLPDNYAGASGWTQQLKLRAGTEPLVLNYHNITPEETKKPYDVHAVQFRGQMKMLHEAGYTAMTGAQYVDFLQGKFDPKPNSFLLTFDDGASGTYRFADPILEEFGFHGMVMLISQSVGQNAPYYLTWAQIRKMQKSSRWSFGAHSAGSHRRITAENGNAASAFANRDATDGSLESLEDYRVRIIADMKQLETDFAREKVELVPLFAWPFSETAVGEKSRRKDTADDLTAAKVALDEVKSTYAASFTNVESPGPQSYHGHQNTPIERLEIRISHTLKDFARRILAIKSLPPGKTYSLPKDHAFWTKNYVGTDTPVDSDSPEKIQLPGKESTYQATWAVAGTQHWQGYTANFTLGDALSPGGSRAGVMIDQVAGTRLFVGASADKIYVAERMQGQTNRLIDYTIDEPTAVQVVVENDTISVTVGENKTLVRQRLKLREPVGPVGVILTGDGSNTPQIHKMTVTGAG